MDFVRVNSLNIDPDRNLELFPLRALQASREQYSSLLLQPEGGLKADPDGVKHFDADSAYNTYTNLFQLASNNDLDLIVTPEYSVPWSVIKKIIRKEITVKKGALWALGSESINLNELAEFKAFCEEAGVRVLYEQLEHQNKNYLCPLVYICWERKPDGQEEICVLIQFKTYSCGGTFEVDNLYVGKSVYIFGDGNTELNLFSLICADVFEFKENLIQQHHLNSLIFHIQLNQKPWHRDFKKYRDYLFTIASNSTTQLICLNWATEVKWFNKDKPERFDSWSNCANSAFYLPNLIVKKFKDSELDKLHKGGIYYNRVDSFWDLFLLGNTPQVLIVKLQPIRFDGPQALRIPFRIEITRRLVPDNINNSWIEENEVDDGFNNLLCETQQEDNSSFKKSLSKIHSVSPLGVERSLELLQGPKGSSNSWHNRYELSALELASDESPQRVTMNYEDCTSRAGVEPRKRRLQVGYDASTLYELNLDWPAPLKDIGEGFDFGWNKSSPHCNVYPIGSTENPATLIYVETAINGYVETMFKKMVSGIQKNAFEVDSENFLANMVRAKDRLCVVYKERHQFKFHHESDGKKSITIPANQSVTNFDMDDENEY